MNSEATEINKIEVKVEPKIDTQYNVEIWLLESTDYQNLLLVKPEEKEISPVNISFEYDIPLTKNLTIEKVDSRNNSIKLKGVGFIIQNKETGKSDIQTYIDELEKIFDKYNARSKESAVDKKIIKSDI